MRVLSAIICSGMLLLAGGCDEEKPDSLPVITGAVEKLAKQLSDVGEQVMKLDSSIDYIIVCSVVACIAAGFAGMIAGILMGLRSLKPVTKDQQENTGNKEDAYAEE